MASEDLIWTGERYLPEINGDIAMEHWHRYVFAGEFAAEKVVLDIACGEGYGTAFLARKARMITGIDIDPKSVNHAKNKYISDNLSFLEGSCCAIPLETNSVDLITSFETIEHVEDHEGMMRELVRVLRPGGTVIISSPNKMAYSDVPASKNIYHKKELYEAEFHQLVHAAFANIYMLRQRIIYGSVILGQEPQSFLRHTYHVDNLNSATQEDETLPDPMYFLAVCSDAQIDIPDSSILEQGLQTAIRCNSEFQQMEELLMKERLENNLSLQLANRRIDKLKHELSLRENSLSWKITAPLRAIMAAFSRK